MIVTWDGVPALLGLFEQGVCELNFCLSANLSEVSNIVQRYQDLPASLADACLVRMSETTPHSVIMTLDAHFCAYRRNRRQRIPLLLPPEV
jgi:predicted nucleic acid-binding protein